MDSHCSPGAAGDRREELRDALARARQRTLAIVELVEEADFCRAVDPEYSPIGWHVGHIGMTEAYWVLQRAMGCPPSRLDYFRLFSPAARPRAERGEIPTRSDILRYLCDVRAQVEEALAAADLGSEHPLLRDGFVFYSVLQHEWQHQETLVELLRLAGPVAVPPPPVPSAASRPVPPPQGTPERIAIPAGTFLMGSDAVEAYDNERPAHHVPVREFAIESFPVTNVRFRAFLDDGGYWRQQWWSAEGWAWRHGAAVESPRFWERDGEGGWLTRDVGGRRALPPDHPVEGVSWHEAEAFCRWSGGRLPTEAEWEMAAAWDGERSRRFPWGDAPPTAAEAVCDVAAWATAPVSACPAGRSAAGCWSMGGNVWEWTSSPFTGYPGFKPFPYRGYSGAFVGGPYRVLKGGSWATPGPLLRCAFRNWYRPAYRQAALGFRCCALRDE